MPALFCLALDPALRALQPELRDGVRVVAYLDDVYILATPERPLYLHSRLEHHMAVHTQLRLNPAKTVVRNGAGLPDFAGRVTLAAGLQLMGQSLTPSSVAQGVLERPAGSFKLRGKLLRKGASDDPAEELIFFI